MRVSTLMRWLLPAVALAGCGGPATIDIADQATKRLVGGTRGERLQALAQLPGFAFVPTGSEATLVELLADTDPEVRSAAAVALQNTDPKTQGHLVPMIQKAFDTEADAGVKQRLKIALDVARGVIERPDRQAPRPVSFAP